MQTTFYRAFVSEANENLIGASGQMKRKIAARHALKLVGMDENFMSPFELCLRRQNAAAAIAYRRCVRDQLPDLDEPTADPDFTVGLSQGVI